MRKRFVLLGAVVLVAAACARQPMRGQPAPALDRKLSTFAWIEEGDLASLIVGTRAARYRENERYIPIEIAFANRGLKTMTLSRESFVLKDAEGNRYPCAGPKELLEEYEFLDMDQGLAELRDIVFNRFAAFTYYPNRFSPTRDGAAAPGGSSIVRDVTSLPRYGYMIEFFYFPRPVSGLIGKKMELSVSAPELEQPIYVRFVVE